MKQLFKALALVLVLVFAMSGAAMAATYTVGTNPEFPPFEYVGDDGEVTGIDVDIINALMAIVDPEAEVVIESMAFDALLPSLATGQIDIVIAGMSATEERRQSVDFTEAYFVANQAILVKADDDTVTTAEEFIPALSDPDCSAITVSGEIEITGGSYTIGKPVTTGGLDNSLYFLNAQVVNNSTITVLPFEVTDETVNSSGFYAEAYPYTEPASFSNNGTLTIQEGGYASVVVDTITNTGTIDNSGDFYLGAVGETVNRGTINNQGYFSIPIFRQLDEETQEQIILPCGPVTNAAGAAINNSGDFFVSWSTESFTNAGTIISNGASFEFICPVTNTGTLTIQDGCYSSVFSITAEMAADGSDHIAGLTNSGTITVTGGATLDLNSNGAENQSVNTGTITVADGSGLGVIGGAALDNQGTLTVSGQDASLSVGADYTYYDEELGEDVHVSNTGTLVNTGTITGSGSTVTIFVASQNSVLTNNGTILLESDNGYISVREGAALVNAGAGSITAGLEIGVTWEDDRSDGSLTNSGNISVPAGHDFLMTSGSTAANNGTITIAAGGGLALEEGASVTGSEVVDQNQTGEEA